jgi:predicted DNA-binding transcriptional regulator YafY
MNKKKSSRMSKTSRQLAIFHIFLCSKVVEIAEITKLIERSNKTIMRDLQELQNAGLLDIKFSKKEKGYVHIDDKKHCPFSAPMFSDNKAKNMHLEKLIRLATIMIELRYHTEVPYYEGYGKNQETCSSWYKKRFPSLSKRTMQRDFKELNKIGYKIGYNRCDKYYMVEFPDGLEGIENRLKQLQGEN